ncbi:MAG: antitoxin AF2212-like protein [Acidobacteriota bacterium]
MSTVVDAIFDGTVFRPSGKVPLKPNTRVQITVEVNEDKPRNGISFLELARSLELQGPADFSDNLDDYLYGGKEVDGE